MVSPHVFDRTRSLCDVCQAVLESFGTTPDEGILGRTAQSLLVRSAQGCPLCSLFLGTLGGAVITSMRADVQILYEKHPDRGEIVTTYFKQEARAGYYDINADLSVRSDRPDPDVGLRSTLSVLDPTALQFPPTGDLTESLTVSDKSLILAKKWIEECKARHVECRQMTTGFRPTRLIDIGNRPVDQIRLCMGKDLNPDASYFTLSHCWGTKIMPERLLKENLHASFISVDYDKLPRNFQDAISIVRRLGGRYLWIDSLCIVQDSVEDWQHESALMGQVYLNGRCNLSAVASEDSSVGMIFKREPLDILPLRTTLSINHEEQEVYLCDPRLWYNGIARAPLLKRAWVCQERLLSSCNLHFGQTQILWECPTHTACETFPDGIPLELEKFATEPLVKRKGDQLLRSTSSSDSRSLDHPLHPLRLWNQIVELYSTCQLSYRDDKLIAIGGLAALSHDNFAENGHTYLAGLWQQYLPYQLLWESLSIAKYHSPPSYRAPTWSWAAVDHAILMHKTSSLCTSLIEIINVHIDLVGENNFGQVKGGYLEVKCSLAPARLDQYGWLVPTSSTEARALLCTWDYPRSANPGYEDETFYLLPVCAGNYKTTLETQDSERSHSLTGLAITKAKGNSGDFVRCGIFDMEDDDAEDVMESCRTFANDAASSGLRYLENGQNGMRFIIKII